MKRRFSTVLTLFSLVLLFVLALAVPVLAWDGGAPETPLDAAMIHILEFLASVGVAPLLWGIIELLKSFGAIKDGMAGKAAGVLAVLAFVVLALLNVFSGFDITGETAQLVLGAAMAVIKILGLFGGAVGTRKLLKVAEVVG